MQSTATGPREEIRATDPRDPSTLIEAATAEEEAAEIAVAEVVVTADVVVHGAVGADDSPRRFFSLSLP